MNKHNNTKLSKTIIIIVICILVISLLLGILPDIIILFREKLKQISFLNGIFADEITNEIYLNTIIGPIFSCAAIFISILAFSTAKANEKNQSIKKNASIIVSATKITTFIKRNMNIIFMLNKGTDGDISKLSTDDIIQDAATLYSSRKISFDQFEFIQIFSKCVYKIADLHNIGKDDDKQKAINLFCEKYFQEETVEWTQELIELQNSLKKTINEVK